MVVPNLRFLTKKPVFVLKSLKRYTLSTTGSQ
jgi:hypothetical protein